MLNETLGQLKKALYNGWLIPVIYCMCMAIILQRDHMLSDFDGTMHYFSGEDIFRGNGYRGWGSHFWPPLFSLLTGILSRWLDGAIAASLISIVSASLLLWVSHRFVYKLSGNSVVACIAQLLITTNYIFVLLSIKSETHMLDSLFYVWAILLLLQSLEDNKPRYFLIGLVSGLAGLTRYTSYALIPAFILTLFCFYSPRRAGGRSAIILAGFVLVSSPWWIINYLNNGSPLASWQYMNVGCGVFANKGNWLWWWHGIDRVNSVTDIIVQAPGAYLLNFFKNIFRSVYLVVMKGQLTGMVCMVAVLLLIYRQHQSRRLLLLRGRLFLPVLLAFACYVVVVSQAFVFDEVFLSWLVLVVIYGSFAMYRLDLVSWLFRSRYKPAVIAAIVMGIGLDVYYTNLRLSRYLGDTTGLEESPQIAAALRAQDTDLDKKIVMTAHPGRAYYLGSAYVMLPLYYPGDLSGLVSYKGMSFKVREHAPRFPSTINVHDLKVDYFIYDRWAIKCLPQFSFLLEKNNDRIPSNFQLIYLSPQVAVYRINGQFAHQKH